MSPSRFKTGALSHVRFRWFYLARTISYFGSSMTPVALAFAVLQAPHGQHLLGLILGAELLPNVIMVLIGGSLADRYRRDVLIQLASLGSGLTQAGIAAVVLTGSSPYWILPLAVVSGVIGAFTAPAVRGIVPEVVEKGYISEANALLNTSRSVAKVVGPAAAGVLVASVGGGWGIAVDALSFVLAALCMARVRIPSHPPASTESLLHQMQEGWAYFRQKRWIWSITGAWTFMNFLQMGAWRVLGPIIAVHSFGSLGWGFALSFQAVGLLLASLAMLRFKLTRPLRDGMAAAALLGIPMVVLGQGLALPYLMAATTIAGIGSTIASIAWDTSLQQGVPQDKLSRVMAFDDFGSYAAIPLGVILAVPAAERLGLHAVVRGAGLAFIAMALLPLSLRLVRRLTAADLEAMGQQEDSTVARER